MKIISWNVNGRVEGALARQMKNLLSRDADLVALQEVTRGSLLGWLQGLTDAGYSVVHTADLAALPYADPKLYKAPPFPRKPPKRRIERKNFNLIASRYPIAAIEGISFTDEVERALAFPEKYVAARLVHRGRPFEVHNAHLPPGASRGVIKVHAFEAIRRRADKSADIPLVLCGDFNAPLSEMREGPVIERGGHWDDEIQDRWIAAEKSVVMNPNLPDAWRVVHGGSRKRLPISHYTGKTARRYDYVFTSHEVRVRDCTYLEGWLKPDRNGHYLSDHAPVEVAFAI